MIQYVADLDALRANKRNVYRINQETYTTHGLTFAAALSGLDLTGHDYTVGLSGDDRAIYYDDLDTALGLLSLGELTNTDVTIRYDGEGADNGWTLSMTMQYLTVAEREADDESAEHVFRWRADRSLRPRLVASHDFPVIRSLYGEYHYRRGADGQPDRWEPVSPADKLQRLRPDQIGARLAELCRSAGLTQQQLAASAGVSLVAVEKYISGDRSLMRANFETVIRIADALGVSLDQLIA